MCVYVCVVCVLFPQRVWLSVVYSLVSEDEFCPWFDMFPLLSGRRNDSFRSCLQHRHIIDHGWMSIEEFISDVMVCSLPRSRTYPFLSDSRIGKGQRFRDGNAAYPHVVVCHDMAGGYHVSDECAQGADLGVGGLDEALVDSFAYHFDGMANIDTFIYFSHCTISPPPRSWIACAHRRAVPILVQYCPLESNCFYA